MKRDIQKAIAQGDKIVKEKGRLDLEAKDFYWFYDRFCSVMDGSEMLDAVFQVIEDAYKAGLAIGCRNGR